MHSIRVDQGEFEMLYRTHYARLIRLCCLWLDDPHEAEDVVQEVLLKLLKVSRGPHRPTAWEPWPAKRYATPTTAAPRCPR